MKRFGDLEDRMNEETVLELGMMFNEEIKHHLAQFILNRDREIVQETEQILKSNQL